MVKYSHSKFGMAAIQQFLLVSVMLLVQGIIYFVSAGYINNLRPWIYFSAAFVHYLVSIAVQYRLHPKLLVQRLKVRRKGSKLWDELLMRVTNLMVIILIPAVAGLDSRFGWSPLDAGFIFLGAVLILVSSILLNWAMVVNPYFEPTVRIQKERDHKVVEIGPYSAVRHPGYVSGILFVLSIPLIIESLVSFVPVLIYLFSVILRTWLEDKTLQEELEGYSEYASRVRYRLFPWIW